MAPERKLYQDLKKNTKGIIWNRIENLSLLGMPDVLGYNNSSVFFTVELKVAKGNKVKFSPHQIAFHKSHPKKTSTNCLRSFFDLDSSNSYRI